MPGGVSVQGVSSLLGCLFRRGQLRFSASAPSSSRTGKLDAAQLKGMIVFVSDRSGTLKIWTMHASGKDPKQLTKDQNPDADPRFAPDGKRIMYTSLRGGFPEIWVMNRDGSEPKFITKGA